MSTVQYNTSTLQYSTIRVQYNKSTVWVQYNKSTVWVQYNKSTVWVQYNKSTVQYIDSLFFSGSVWILVQLATPKTVLYFTVQYMQSTIQ